MFSYILRISRNLDRRVNGTSIRVQVTILTIYDICKAVDRGMVISDIQLLEKSGGKSGNWKRSS